METDKVQNSMVSQQAGDSGEPMVYSSSVGSGRLRLRKSQSHSLSLKAEKMIMFKSEGIKKERFSLTLGRVSLFVLFNRLNNAHPC